MSQPANIDKLVFQIAEALGTQISLNGCIIDALIEVFSKDRPDVGVLRESIDASKDVITKVNNILTTLREIENG